MYSLKILTLNYSFFPA